jgi:hypothetical protein
MSADDTSATPSRKVSETATSSLLEEFKILTNTAQQNMQMLLTWFSFFFAFELVAFGWLAGATTTDSNLMNKTTKEILVSGFLVKHVISWVALWGFHEYLNKLKVE